MVHSVGNRVNDLTFPVRGRKCPKSESIAPAMVVPVKVARAHNPLRQRRADANGVGDGDANK